MNYTVAHYTEHRNLSNGVLMFDLDAPYQRGAVWTGDQRHALIRSMLEGVPIGSLVIAKLGVETVRDGVSPYRVIDGKQRIETLRAFHDDQFAVPGWWWEEADLTVPRDRDVTYSNLSNRGRARFENRVMPSLEFDSDVVFLGIEPGTENRLWGTRTNDEAIAAEADLYLRVNFGGVDQTDTDRDRATAVAAKGD